MSSRIFLPFPYALIAGLAALTLSGCGSSLGPSEAKAAELTANQEAADTEAMREVEIAAREQSLAEKEAEFAHAQAEAELARAEKEADLSKREAALATSETKKTTSKKKSPAPTRVALATATAIEPTTQPDTSYKPLPITVPTGTQLSVNLSSDISTKTAKVGDPIGARLATDVIVNGRTALAAGSTLHGTVTQVVSGSSKIGGLPTLALTFDRVDLGNGNTVPITGRVVQQGRSETGRDTAKIVGGAAAGAIIGHQADDDKGKLIGAVLGGAAGAVAARKTGGEVSVPAGSTVVFATEAPFEVSGV